MLANLDFEDMVSRCRSDNAKAYIKEAVDCYRIGSYRACIITTWIALVYDLIDKLRELSLAGDTTAKKQVVDFDRIQKARDTEAALKFERNILDTAKDGFELISAQEASDLNRLFEDRNRCGHPNLNREGEIYAPPPELARLHLRNAIEHVLERPPAQGKAGVAILQQTVDSDYFPIVLADAEAVLSATPLARAKPGLVKEFVMGALTSLLAETLTEKKKRQRVIAIQVAQKLHLGIVDTLLKKKLSDIILKAPDDQMFKVIWLLSSYHHLQAFLFDATWIKINNYVESIPIPEVKTVLLAIQIEKCEPSATNRIQAANNGELSGLVNNLTERPAKALIDKCIHAYGASISFDIANWAAKMLIRPLIPYITVEEGTAIQTCAASNSQVKGGFEFERVDAEIRSRFSAAKP